MQDFEEIKRNFQGAKTEKIHDARLVMDVKPEDEDPMQYDRSARAVLFSK